MKGQARRAVRDAAAARAEMMDVFPTPGLPSERIGLLSCIARMILAAFFFVDGAERANPPREMS